MSFQLKILKYDRLDNLFQQKSINNISINIWDKWGGLKLCQFYMWCLELIDCILCDTHSCLEKLIHQINTSA